MLNRLLKSSFRNAVASERFRGLLARAGYELNPVGGASGESLPNHLRALLRMLEVNCVLDVGANTGQYGLLLRGLGYSGRIVSFEPVKESFTHLSEVARGLGDWKCMNLALGRSEGTTQIHRARQSVFDSLLAPSQYSRQEFGEKSEVIGSETVSITQLDRVFDECVGDVARPRVLLKTDTQGYDLEVVAGASSSLSRIVAIQMELSIKPVYIGMPDYLSALQRLAELGYETTGLFPVNRDSSLRVIEFDCVAVRRGFA